MWLNNFAINIFVVVNIVFGASGTFAQVLRLGESEVRGEKARPETTTFISRARTATEKSTIVSNGKEIIKSEVKDTKVFDVFYKE